MIFLALLVLFIFCYLFGFLITEEVKNLIEIITLVFIVISIIVCVLK
jgi:hypothetical protein